MKLKASSFSGGFPETSRAKGLSTTHSQHVSEEAVLGVPKLLTTVEMAECLRISPKTPIAALSRAGHYLGMVPCKLSNGRLLWDADKVSRLLKGEVL